MGAHSSQKSGLYNSAWESLNFLHKSFVFQQTFMFPLQLNDRFFCLSIQVYLITNENHWLFWDASTRTDLTMIVYQELKVHWVLHCSESLLNYCVPTSLKRLGFDSLNTLMVFFNQFDSFHRVLSDVIKSWREMIILCFVALGTWFVCGIHDFM